MDTETLLFMIPAALFAVHGFCGFKLAKWENPGVATMIALGWALVSGWMMFEMSVATGWDDLIWFLAIIGIPAPSLVGLGGGYLAGVMSRPKYPPLPAE